MGPSRRGLQATEDSQAPSGLGLRHCCWEGSGTSVEDPLFAPPALPPCLLSPVYTHPWGSQTPARPRESQLAAELCPCGSRFLPSPSFSLWPQTPRQICLSVSTTDDLDVRYTAVSSFIFLRFFAPAILSPNLFQLTPHHTVSEPQAQLTGTSQPDPSSRPDPPSCPDLPSPPDPSSAPDPSSPLDPQGLGKVLLAEWGKVQRQLHVVTELWMSHRPSSPYLWEVQRHSDLSHVIKTVGWCDQGFS